VNPHHFTLIRLADNILLTTAVQSIPIQEVANVWHMHVTYGVSFFLNCCTAQTTTHSTATSSAVVTTTIMTGIMVASLRAEVREEANVMWQKIHIHETYKLMNAVELMGGPQVGGPNLVTKI